LVNSCNRNLHVVLSRPSTAFLVVLLLALGSSGGFLGSGVSHATGVSPPSLTDCVGVAPSKNVSAYYIPPCYGHDEPTISFISSAKDSGTNDKFQMVLPASSSSFPQGYYYAAMWFGGVLYDSKSLDNQAFLELQFYPASHVATGPNSGS